MSSPVTPRIRELALPLRSGVSAVLSAADSVVAEFERLAHENAALREENAELSCRVEELESERMEAAGSYRRPVAQSIVQGVQS